MVFASPPARRRIGPSRRDSYRTPRRRKISPEQEVAIRVLVGNRTLRELAAEFGVSRETICELLRPSVNIAEGGTKAFAAE